MKPAACRANSVFPPERRTYGECHVADQARRPFDTHDSRSRTDGRLFHWHRRAEPCGREKNRAILATKSGLEAIVLERGGAVEAPRLSFQIAPGSDLGEIASRLKKADVKCERRSDITPGIGEAIAFQDPKGTTTRDLFRFRLCAAGQHVQRHHAAEVRPHRLPMPGRDRAS